MEAPSVRGNVKLEFYLSSARSATAWRSSKDTTTSVWSSSGGRFRVKRGWTRGARADLRGPARPWRSMTVLEAVEAERLAVVVRRPR